MTQIEDQKRPRTAPPEVRRQQLIGATIDCIARAGISGTTLNSVTKEAGLSLGLVNFHFKSKDALLAATLAHLAEEHRQHWMRKVDGVDVSAADKLRSIVEAQFHPGVCNRKKLAVWFAFFGDSSLRKSYRGTTGDIDMERQKIASSLCDRIIAEGGYDGVSAEDVALSLEGLFDGFWLNILMYPAKFTRESARRHVMDFLERAFPDHFKSATRLPVGS